MTDQERELLHRLFLFGVLSLLVGILISWADTIRTPSLPLEVEIFVSLFVGGALFLLYEHEVSHMEANR